MAKAWAKIVVGENLPWKNSWIFEVVSDLGGRNLPSFNGTRAQARARARAWSRRLGNIPVEVEE